MPVEFLSDVQKSQYGQYHEEPNEAQLARYFHLDETDKSFISERRGDHNKLAVAIQITTARYLGTFLSDVTTIPVNALAFVLKQLSITDTNTLSSYSTREGTKREHTALIRRHYGFHSFGDPPWSFRLSRQIYTRAWVGNERPSLLFDFATGWLIQNKVLLPGATTLSRLISEIRERVEKRLWNNLSSLPDGELKAKLDALLQVPSEQKGSNLEGLRKGPVTVSGLSFKAAISRYQSLHELGVSSLDFSKIPPSRLRRYGHQIAF